MSDVNYATTVKNTHTNLKSNALNFWEVSAQAVGANLAEYDCGVNRAADVRYRRHSRMALLSVRHNHAAVRGDQPEPVCQAIHVRGEHV